MHAPLPPNEQERLKKLSEYCILDTPPEKEFDDIVRLAAQVCDCPVAGITLIDRDRTWLKAVHGGESREFPRDASFCAHAILGPGLMHVADTALDARFRDNPFVTGEPHIRFYAAAPLLTPGGEALGALCVLDRSPRELSPAQRDALEPLSRIVMTQLELRKRTAEQQRALAEEARTAQALDESRRTLAAMMGNVPGMVYRCRRDRRWDMEFISRGCAALTGYEPQELTEGGRAPFATLIAPAYQGVVWAEIQAALRRRRPFRLVYPLTTRTGARRWVWEQGSGVFSPDGDLLHLEGFVTDITERYEAEEALRERERQLQTVTDNVPALIARVDAECRYVFANRAYQEWLGVPSDQVIGRTVAEVLGEGAFRAICPYIDRVLTGEAVTYDAALCFRTLGRRSVHVSYVPEFGADGVVTGFILSALDTTSQQEEAQARAEAERRLATVVANLPVVIWAIDAEGVFTFSDGLALARVGLRPGQLVGQSIFERFAGQPDLLGYLQEAFAGERVHWTAERAGVIFETHVTPLQDDTGRITGLLGVSHDVSERRRAEEALGANEAKYRRLAESGVIGVIAWRPDGGLLDTNDKFLEMTGYTRADFEAGRMRWDDMTPPEWKPGCREAVRRLFEIGSMGPYEKEFFRKDGSRLPVLMGGALLEGRSGGICFVLDLTERKLAETSLDRERKRFRLLAEGLGAGLIMTDLDDRIQYVNPRMAEIAGYTPDEMTGRLALDLLLAPAEQEAMRRNNRDRAEGAGGVYEIKMTHKDGRPRWLEVHAVPFRDESGRVVGTLSTNIDVTERVRAQAALRESEQRRWLALSGGRLGWWDLDLTTGEYREFSDQCKAHLGLPPDTPLCYGDFAGRIHPDDRARVESEGRRALAEGRPYAAEYRVVWPDGAVHWLSVHGTPVQDEPGRMIGVTQEVTERRQTEEALRERTEVLESVLSTIPHQVFWKDRDSVYLGCNANFARAAGLATPEEVVGKTDADLPWTPEEAEAYRRDDLRVIQSGTAFMDQEEGYLHNDGSATVGLTSKLPLHDSEGRTIGLLGVSQDITERKALEAERERLLVETGTLLAEAVERADRDPLTGLLNHRAFQRRLAEEADRAQREGTTLAVAMLDLDNFKFFNDSYGHLAGDDVLRRVAEGLGQHCRSYDTVARFGGDEFAVLMPGLGAADAARLTQRTLDNLGGQGYVPPGYDTPVPLGLSAGVAVFPTEAPSRVDVLAMADERLRLTKSGGDDAVLAALDVRAEMSRRVEGFSMLDALVAAVDNKDRYTRRHSEGVLTYCLDIARELGLDEATRRTISVAALLHDVGKIGVPDHILRKPGKLTDDEFEAMKQHPMMGAVMVGAVPGFEETLDAVRHHHERWDGGGYPFGLRGEETPLVARLMAVADAFSAMTTDRPYRKGLTEARALSILEAGAGTQWDPSCVRAFLKARTGRPSVPAHQS